MAASYPSSIKTYTTLVDAVDFPQAVHINSPQDEISAIETELGVNPRTIDDTVAPGATPASVAAYLDMVANQIKAITGKASWVTAPVRSLESFVSGAAGAVLRLGTTDAFDLILRRNAIDKVTVGATSTNFVDPIVISRLDITAGAAGRAGTADAFDFILKRNNVDKVTLGSALTTFADPVVLPADPTTALQAATKQYVDAGGVVITAKTGSGAGNYTTTSTTDVDIDATNLAYAVTVASGKEVLIVATATVSHSLVAGTTGSIFLVIADGTTALAETLWSENTVSLPGEVSVSHVFTGDGASHTFKLRWRSVPGATATMQNASAIKAPRMSFVGA